MNWFVRGYRKDMSLQNEQKFELPDIFIRKFENYLTGGHTYLLV